MSVNMVTSIMSRKDMYLFSEYEMSTLYLVGDFENHKFSLTIDEIEISLSSDDYFSIRELWENYPLWYISDVLYRWLYGTLENGVVEK